MRAADGFTTNESGGQRDDPRSWAVLGVLTVAIVALGTLASGYVLGFPSTGIDDARITFVYARHLVEGHGFVFTPGFERVEGFTSPAWVLVSALLFAVTERPEPAILAVCVLLSAVSVFAVLATIDGLLHAWARDSSPARTAESVCSARAVSILVASIWLAGAAGFFGWNTWTLMDSSLWCAGIHVATYLLVRDVCNESGVRARPPLALGIVGGVLVATRPESLLLVPLFLGLGVVLPRQDQSSVGTRVLRWLPAGLVPLAVLGLLTALRWQYFGYPLPNTYYAKVSSDRIYNAIEGVRYLKQFATYDPTAVLLIAISALVLYRLLITNTSRNERSRLGVGSSAVAAVAGVGISLVLVTGGDHFGSWRFFQPFVPLLIVPAVSWYLSLADREPAAFELGTLPALVIGLTWLVTSWSNFYSNHDLRNEFDIAERGQRIGQVLNDAVAPGSRPTLGVVPAGGIAFAYEGRVLDLMGLNWTEMAHSPGDRRGFHGHAAFDADVFWRTPPDVVVPRVYEGTPTDAGDLVALGVNHVLKGIFHTERFRREFSPGYFRQGELSLTGFFGKRWLAESGFERFRPLPWDGLQD